jgi:hypothetical protein
MELLARELNAFQRVIAIRTARPFGCFYKLDFVAHDIPPRYPAWHTIGSKDTAPEACSLPRGDQRLGPGNTDANRCGERSAASEAVGPLRAVVAAQTPLTSQGDTRFNNGCLND